MHSAITIRRHVARNDTALDIQPLHMMPSTNALTCPKRVLSAVGGTSFINDFVIDILHSHKV